MNLFESCESFFLAAHKNFAVLVYYKHFFTRALLHCSKLWFGWGGGWVAHVMGLGLGLGGMGVTRAYSVVC